MSLSELSPIHVAKDEERQSPARSFMILQICGKQLHRSVICGAHESYRRILVTEGVRRQRLELAI